MGYNERLEYCFKQMQPFGYTAEEIDGAARRMMLTGLLVYPDVDYEENMDDGTPACFIS